MNYAFGALLAHWFTFYWNYCLLFAVLWLLSARMAMALAARWSRSPQLHPESSRALEANC